MRGGWSALALTRERPWVLPALVLWGWQTEFLPWAIGMGMLIEAARIYGVRFEIRQPDFNRLWNFTTLLFLGVALYLFLARQGFENVGTLAGNSTPAQRMDSVRQVSQTAIEFLRWLPFIFYPFVLAHTWSSQATLPWSTFSLYRPGKGGRHRDIEGTGLGARQVHPGHPYVGLILFASCTSMAHPAVFLPLFLLATVTALWPWRNPHYSVPAWIGLFVLLAGCALVAQQSLSVVRLAWRAMENQWVRGAMSGDFDQVRSATALGLVGRLKESGRIVLRIETRNAVTPGLMREAAYNRFRSHIWTSKHREFSPIAPVSEDPGVKFRLVPEGRTGARMTVSRYTIDGEAPLALPASPLYLFSLNPDTIETNYMAATRLLNGPSLAVYTVEHGDGGGFDGPPEPDDVTLDTLGDEDGELIRQVSEQLGLPGMTHAEAIGAVQRFFASRFEYSLWQRPPRRQGGNTTALSRFLLETRSGHCEFFATATALLLRTAGVPTRYAVGYSPSERKGNWWLARGRDAHAWCLVYAGGQWRDFDTTPGVWRERESAQALWWEGIRDRISNARYRFDLWRHQGGNWRIGVFTAGLVVLLWLAWKQLRGSRWRRASHTQDRSASRLVRLGLDSELARVLDQLESRHGTRPGHETPLDWLDRLQLTRGPMGQPLREAIRLHERLRFDPRGLPTPDRDRLRRLAKELQDSLARTGA